ncbi:ribonuclease HI [Bacillus paranthracis]|uniref:ribonuclease HI n=1 Tax=Bacillus paranthracis TaxID=2026186 RepID=UPI002D77E447|nr:ribonuclease HI [Bacillus paranthracis]
MSKFIIYCDGGCRGNQSDENIGGWGALLSYNDNEKELYEGVRNTTNNKMELTACIKALEAIHGNTAIPVEIYVDSAYVCNGMNSWVKGWIARGWKKADKKPVENQDLWKRLVHLASTHDDIKFLKVKGHADNEGNNRADALANKAMDEIS